MPSAPTSEKPRKLTLGAAVDRWEETTRAIEGLTILRKEAAEVLLAHAEKTGKRTYKDRIAAVSTGGSMVLNQPKAAEYLLARGQVLVDFQKQTKLGLSLKLLK